MRKWIASVLLLAVPGIAGGAELSVQEALLRAKPTPSLPVILSRGLGLPATVGRYRPPVAGEGMSGRNLALLKLDAADMPSLTLGDSSNAKIGDKLHILGFPGVVVSHELLSASAQVEASVTNGEISGFKQDIANQPVIQTDAPAAWGDSGGAARRPHGGGVCCPPFLHLA